jgi:hypothetical protein
VPTRVLSALGETQGCSFNFTGTTGAPGPPLSRARSAARDNSLDPQRGGCSRVQCGTSISQWGRPAGLVGFRPASLAWSTYSCLTMTGSSNPPTDPTSVDAGPGCVGPGVGAALRYRRFPSASTR